jgi:hypothetical protein
MDKAIIVVASDLPAGVEVIDRAQQLTDLLFGSDFRVARNESIHRTPHNVSIRQEARAELVAEHLAAAINEYVDRHGAKVLELDGVRRRPHILPIQFPDDLMDEMSLAFGNAIELALQPDMYNEETAGFIQNLRQNHRVDTIVHSIAAVILPRLVEKLLKGEALY